jgi:hypothetical protein
VRYVTSSKVGKFSKIWAKDKVLLKVKTQWTLKTLNETIRVQIEVFIYNFILFFILFDARMQFERRKAMQVSEVCSGPLIRS